LLVYVDDILLTALTSDFFAHIVKLLRQEFAIKDLGDIRFFLGVQVRRDEHGFFLNQA
jgi:histone deacetylase 1/2